MKKHLIAANWKSNKTKNEAKNWLEEFSKDNFSDQLEIVIFAPFTLLDFISEFVIQNSLPIKVGAQNMSMFDAGPYTGEVNATQIKEFSDYVLIGHSERKSNFGEDSGVIRKKVENALSAELSPVVCISDFEEAREIEGKEDVMFVFEPPSAISSNSGGVPEDIETVSRFSDKFSATFQNKLLYGGSINAQNIKDYINVPGISGVLVGAESLSAQSFSEIIKNAV